MDRATEQRVTERQSNGATERRSNGVTERRSDGLNKQQSDIKTKQISDGGTERRSNSNKTNISRLINCWCKIHDSTDLEQGFSHAPTVGVLEKYQ